MADKAVLNFDKLVDVIKKNFGDSVVTVNVYNKVDDKDNDRDKGDDIDKGEGKLKNKMDILSKVKSLFGGFGDKLKNVMGDQSGVKNKLNLEYEKEKENSKDKKMFNIFSKLLLGFDKFSDKLSKFFGKKTDGGDEKKSGFSLLPLIITGFLMFVPILMKFFSKVKLFFNVLRGGIKIFEGGEFLKFSKYIDDLKKIKVSNKLKNVVEGIKDFFKTKIVSKFSKIGDMISDIFKGFKLGGIYGKLSKVFNKVFDIGGVIFNFVKRLGSSMIGVVKKVIGGIAVGGKAFKGVGKIFNFLSPLVNVFGKIIKPVLRFIPFVSIFFDAIDVYSRFKKKDYVGGIISLVGAIAGFIPGLGGVISIGASFLNMFLDGMKNKKDKKKEQPKSDKKFSLMDVMKNFGNSLLSFINKIPIVSVIKGIIGGIRCLFKGDLKGFAIEYFSAINAVIPVEKLIPGVADFIGMLSGNVNKDEKKIEGKSKGIKLPKFDILGFLEKIPILGSVIKAVKLVVGVIKGDIPFQSVPDRILEMLGFGKKVYEGEDAGIDENVKDDGSDKTVKSKQNEKKKKESFGVSSEEKMNLDESSGTVDSRKIETDSGEYETKTEKFDNEDFGELIDINREMLSFMKKINNNLTELVNKKYI